MKDQLESLKNSPSNFSRSFKNRVKRALNVGTFPKAVTFAVTYKCNSKCIMCNIWKMYQENRELIKDELSISEIRDFFSDREFFRNLAFIQLTGGEPFLRSDLIEIVKSVHECKPYCTVYVATNGFLTERILKVTEEVLHFHQDFSLGVSLDGIGDIHNKVRGVKGAFEKAEKTLLLLRENFPQLHVQVTMTVTPLNLREIPKVYMFAKKCGFVFRVCVSNLGAFYRNVDENFFYSEQDIGRLEAYFHMIKKDLTRELGRFKALPELLWLHGNIQYAVNPQKRLFPCYSSFTRFFLDPYGTVYPCLVYSEELGNIREKKIRKIWFSKRATAVRRKVQEEKCPNCWLAHEISEDISNDHITLLKCLLKLRS